MGDGGAILCSDTRHSCRHWFRHCVATTSWELSITEVLFENNNNEYPPTVGTVTLGEEVGGFKAQGTIQNIDILKDSDWTDQGIASAPVEVDSLVRRIPLLYRTPDGWLASFGTQVLKIMAEAKTYIIKTNQNGIEEVVVQGLPPVKVDSLGRKWVSWIVPRETTTHQRFFG